MDKKGLGVHRTAVHFPYLRKCKFCNESFLHLASHVPACSKNPKILETKMKLSFASSRQIWSEDRKKKQRDTINQKIEEGTWHSSFSKKRIKEYNGEKFDGLWEMKLAIWFDANGIKWERNKKSFSYEFEGKKRKYFPDFYLPNIDCFVEVKGWAVPKDFAKWKQFPYKLVSLSGKDLENLGIDIGPYRNWR